MTREPTTLDEVMDHAWHLLGQGVADRRHGFHHAVVASVSPNGRPRARTVILRAADRNANTLRFHTDIRSQKCRDLEANSAISIVFYDTESRTQLRIEGQASLHHGDEIARQGWAAAQPMSKLTYAITPEPGQLLDQPDGHSTPPPQSDVAWAETNFVVVLVAIEQMQWFYLKQGGQLCAFFDAGKGIASWQVPS